MSTNKPVSVEEILKLGDDILTELKKNPNHITTQLNRDEHISYNTGFHTGFEKGYSQLQSLLAEKEKEIEVWENAHKEASEHFMEIAYDFKKCEEQRDHYKALAEAADDLIDIDPLYVSGYTKEIWNKYQNLKNQTPDREQRIIEGL